MRSKLINDKVNQMLQALGTRVKEAAQTGGQKFREFDDRYAQAVADRIMLSPGDPRGSQGLGAVRNITGAVIGSPITRGPAMVEKAGQAPRMPQTLAENAIAYGGLAASGAARYGIPLAGLTTAGAALADLTGGLYDAASDIPIFPQEEEDNSNTLMIRYS